MKRIVLSAALLVAAMGNAYAETLKIAVVPVPHAEILEFLKPELAKEGVTLDVKVFSDYVQPDRQVDEGQLDANYFQSKPYYDAYKKDRPSSDQVPIVAVHIEPFGAYSKKIKTIAELKDGATVAIPNDPANSGRALLLIAKQGLITLKDPNNIMATQQDIVGNPRHLKFKELEAAMLPRVLNQVDLALINANYALEAKLVPHQDALFIEGSQSPYANYLYVRRDKANDPAVQKLGALLNSPQVKQFILERYHGDVVPAF
ncbi:MetQ/NlpA family ABC transporter substrate-binding protein [Pseudomonas silvicola]|uniref:MetQ/NlpA family ABC transporter substrate-binding protein n=1 Tax=Pseudomonas sp. RIT-To-2 TaxID=3462541 RepID=UPI00227CF56A|nr:MetQ/NlpA family ABC transporter substrate-binding protein [Pseudomonas silvicola]